MPEMSNMRRSHTLRNTRSSMPGGPVVSKATALDDLGVLQEERSGALGNIGTTEAQLRSEIFDRERDNDKLQNQIFSLQTQLAQRPPLSAIQELENEKKSLELMFQGTQRENEKMMIQLERAHDRTRMLENELKKLCGENWQASLNIPPEAYSLRSGGVSSYLENPNFSGSSSSLIASQQPPSRPPRRGRSKSAILPRSLLNHISRTEVPPSVKEDPNSSYLTAADQTRAIRDDSGTDDEGGDVGDDSAEVEDVLQGTDRDTGPSKREIALERNNEALQRQLEQVKLLVLGLDKRLNEREERLTKAIERAEQENRALDVRLRELDLNTL